MEKIEDVLKLKGQYVALTSGISMRPMLRTHRDTVVIKPIINDIAVHDVVLYKRASDGAYILHRVLSINGDTFIIRGDNCLKKEYNIKSSQILGVLTEFYRGNRHIYCTSNGFKIYGKIITVLHPLIALQLKIRYHLSKIKHKLLK